MCGIIGYKSSTAKEVNSILIDGLKRLEYRGYDSFGIAWMNTNTKSFDIVKKKGKISIFSMDKEAYSPMGFGHTRWATHGRVNEINTHPHFSNNRKVGVVHNGIIENFQELRNFLVKEHFTFYSETDTEVIPNLIEYFMSKGLNFLDSCLKTFNSLEGSFAIVVIYLDKDSNNFSMIGVRKGSPLILGIEEHNEESSKDSKTFYLASDAPAFLEYTNKVVFLNDEELVFLDNENVEFYNYRTGKKIAKRLERVHWNIEKVNKSGYKHFMMKEIKEQGNSVKKAINQDKNTLMKIVNELETSKNVFLVGAGTSYHACIAGSYIFSELAGKKVDPILASEFLKYKKFISEDSLIIALSQSGETADLLEAVKDAKLKKAKVVAIVNVEGSTLTRISDYTLMMNAGPEICVLSTKSYTSQLAVLLLLAYASIGKSDEARKIINEVSKEIVKLIDENQSKMKLLAEQILKLNKESIFLIGRYYDYPTALEGALKIKEVSYIHAEGFAGGELKHGTIALIEKGTPVIAFLSNIVKKQTLSNILEVKSRGGFVVGVAPEDNETFDYFIKIKNLGVFNNILMIIPIQLLAYYLAVLKGLDPDKPRNLAKSVTVK